MRVVLLGPPGAGKGTQAGVIASTYGIPHISTGDIFRANLRDETPIGLEAKAFMDAGELVPDDVVIRMVDGRLAETDARNGFLLDGFPRTTPQAEALESLLSDRGTPLDVVLLFEVDEDVLVERLTGRRVHAPTGDIYHLSFNPPPDDIPADELVQRDDDTEEVVRHRLKIYTDETEPLVGFYRQRGLLRTVEAEGEMSDVTARLLAVLAESGEPQPNA